LQLAREKLQKWQREREGGRGECNTFGEKINRGKQTGIEKYHIKQTEKRTPRVI